MTVLKKYLNATGDLFKTYKIIALIKNIDGV